MEQASPGVTNDLHLQFAALFPEPAVQPFAYLVSAKLHDGHICLDLSRLAAERHLLPAALQALLPEGPPDLRRMRFVSDRPQVPQPFMWHNGRLYLQRYFHYETIILERIGAFAQRERAQRHERRAALLELKDTVGALFPPDPTQAGPDWQLVAALQALTQDLTLITGGPGTGKTTTVARILALMHRQHPDLRVALAAPTGKAAARMAESLKSVGAAMPADVAAFFGRLQPSTLHRLLQVRPDSPQFRYNAERPLPYDVLIVDEASMIDVALFAKMMQAIGPGTRLLLLGDKDQLASVEAGSLLGDLCQSAGMINRFAPETASFLQSFTGPAIAAFAGEGLPVAHPLAERIVELQVSRRFSDEAGIGRFSKAVIASDTAELARFLAPGADAAVTVDTALREDLFLQFIEGYTAYIREPDTRAAIALLHRQRVLCAVREGPQGLYALNRAIEQQLVRQGHLRYTGEFYEHRPVMVTRNYYSLGLFNGDVGIVRKDDKGQLRVFFEDSKGELRAILPGYLSHVETVFAMTIHKSQGSEFDTVLVRLPETDLPLLTRELIYTAVTRARNHVLLQAPDEVLMASVSRKVERGSGISGRLATWKPAPETAQNS